MSASIIEIPVAGSPIVSNICDGPDGNLWFSLEGGTNKVGRYVIATGVMTLFTVGNPGDNFGGINTSTTALGGDGNLWLSDNSNSTIYKIRASDGTVLNSYATGTAGVGGICQGADGNMWFMGSQASKVGRITPAGVITLFSTPTAAAFPHGCNLCTIDGNVWFCEEAAGVSNLAFITTAGAITEIPLPSGTAGQPYWINQGDDGHMWFTEITGNRVGKITIPGHVITEWSVPSAASQPGGLWADGHGSMWFVEKVGNNIGVIPNVPPSTSSGVVQKVSNQSHAPVTVAMSTPKVGNLLVALVVGQGGTDAITGPAGWSQIGVQVNNTNCSAAAFYRVVDGSEGSSFTAANGQTVLGLGMQVWEVTNQSATPIGSTSGVDYNSSTGALVTNLTSGAVTPSVPHSLVFEGLVINGANTTFANAWTNGFTQDATLNSHMEWAELATTSTGAITTNESWSGTHNAISFSVVVELNSAAVAVSPITEYPVPTAAANPDKIVRGPDNNMWFTEHDAGALGEILTFVDRCQLTDSTLTRTALLDSPVNP